ncbi:hypothetical protein SELMODRAFT_423104 [Selaginella moellendorffii]|uniref:Multiple myeloma tumor-associated protein 2-like N-terminal domain-containing protein n=1 Tax=Selaginella moellendorffii TaxID=88036 RepID=D8SKK7_SELML|nr:multiple myeloma tumor-associated protein 2 homolog [Selaginella moellendorffii]EFJ14866.1 hypothetical protein SELMODRAFT_423104 [Selaginella moellendorffii]|eukprot:XP_002983854.1 multiple myeloma tumor-associated protein 2 homolog [Selaginella moellendorffii]
MYHPSRGGVRGGRDQFNWDDVKVDKHRENYLGHSVKAPVGRWQRGKDLTWYAKGGGLADAAAKAEIERIKAEEDQAMREALGLAPTRDKRNQVNRLDKHELEELLKPGKTAEELSETYTAAERIQGLGFGPTAASKKQRGYERGEQLAGIQPEKLATSEPAATSTDGGKRSSKEETKERRRQEKNARKEERKAAKLARKEERRHQKELKRRSSGKDEDRDEDEQQHSKRQRHDSDSD